MEIEKLIRENLDTKRIGTKSTPGNARNWHVIEKSSGKSLWPNFQGFSAEDALKRFSDSARAMGMEKTQAMLSRISERNKAV